MVRILIVDDQKIVREGIKILLEKSTEIEIIGDAANGNKALEKVEHLKPDVVLLDIDMPGISGLTVAEKIQFRFPKVKIIMLSSHEDEKYVKKATESGAKGYLLKNASSKELEWSIKLVYQGYSAIKSELLEHQFELQKADDPNLQLERDPKIAKKQSSHLATLSKEEPPSSHKLEVLLAPKQTKAKHSYSPRKARKPKRSRAFFHGAKLSQLKKTMLSFEFNLLMFTILFCMGFLVFIALS